MPEEGRGNYTDIGDVVRVIEKIERIQRYGESRRFLPRFGQYKIVRDVHVQANQTRSVQRVARHSNRTIVHDSVVVIITPHYNGDGLPGVKGKRGANREE